MLACHVHTSLGREPTIRIHRHNGVGWHAFLTKTLLLPGILSVAANASAAEALVAVAANFLTTAQALEVPFEASTGHELVVVSGATGKLYTQITHGAPYDLLLAADQARPARLAADGLTVAGPVTYARGRLGIWVRGQEVSGASLREALTGLRRVALANPSLAPYGVAAMEVIDRLGIGGELEGRIALGENVAQAYALIAAGAADGGLVAWSLLLGGGRAGESIPVPVDWHQPIDQDAVLLRHGESNAAARAFFQYLSSPEGRGIIAEHGYSPL